MELNNEIEVNAPIQEVWEAFNDVERIAPCLPGAQLQEIVGDEYHGVVKVKVGPITAQYKGKAVFVEQNEAERRVKIQADGRGAQGNASALITARLEELAPDRTKVNVDTDLKITGKVAQFGRGMIAEVSTKLMGQFAENFEKMLEEAPAAAEPAATEAATAPASGGAAGETAAPTSRVISTAEPEAVDLLDVAGTPVLKRIALPVGIIFVLLVLRRMFGHKD
ncbi:MAG: SRPBCC family protein [Acidimicrobiales bacterium]|nr:SRPBCC family protein [Acidimicrobiales bacterium]